ncbi:RsiV family protein [Brevundimonas sp.]|uniref:RsiV family protein n=1 Tax=Brevundimonas sp. TaxID=1871086 RepID=UPI003D6CEB22
MIPSRSARILLVTVAVAASLAACQRAEKKEAETPKASAEATATGPLKYESATQWAKVSLTLPEAIKTQPELYAALYRQEVAELAKYAEGAQADRTEAGGESAMGPYEKTIVYGDAVQTGRLFSAMRTDFDYSGGAHPNTVATALLWDKTEKRRITPADLFAKGADLSSLERALCDAVNTAKKARPGATPVKVGGDMWSCPKLKDLAIVLAPGDAPGQSGGKAGGLTFLFDAYAVGPYVEGPYYLTLPASTFQSLLAPAYASEFGGKPLKAGDVTDDLRLK